MARTTVHGAIGWWVRASISLRAVVLVPVFERLIVDRADPPLFQRIGLAIRQALLLLPLTDVEVVHQEPDVGAHQHLLEVRHRAHEIFMLRLSATAHHPLDAGAVVPAAVELRKLPRGRPIRQVALEIPRCAVLLGRHAQRDDAGFTRA